MSAAQEHEVTAPINATKGNFVWHELRTTDAKGAEDFYTHVVGWQAKSFGDPEGFPYKLFSVNGLDAAGLDPQGAVFSIVGPEKK